MTDKTSAGTPKDPIAAFQQEVAGNVRALGTAREFQSLSMAWLRASLPYRYSYNFSAAGRPIIQYPPDMVAINELIWRVRPDLIIETGVAHGGSLIQSAAALALLDYCEGVHRRQPLEKATRGRRVIGVDIEIRPHNRVAIEAHPLAHKIELIEGSSIDQETIAVVTSRIRDDDRVMVLLDSNHTHTHVHAELCAYAPFVSAGSYCVVFDTVVEFLEPENFPDRTWGPGNSPLSAIRAYLAELAAVTHHGIEGRPLAFEIDSEIDNRLLISVAPSGYLRRIPS